MKKEPKQKKQMTPEDLHIWDKITKTAKPLPKSEKNFSYFLDHYADGQMAPVADTQSVRELKTSTAPVFQPPSQQKPISVPQAIDLKTTRKLSKGKISLQGRLDLHGFTQHEAHRLLDDYIENAYYASKKMVLVITGKGDMGRGVLRENVPKWLTEAPLSQYVSGFGQSAAQHGGVGALYVRIRRKA